MKRERKKNSKTDCPHYWRNPLTIPWAAVSSSMTPTNSRTGWNGHVAIATQSNWIPNRVMARTLGEGKVSSSFLPSPKTIPVPGGPSFSFSLNGKSLQNSLNRRCGTVSLSSSNFAFMLPYWDCPTFNSFFFWEKKFHSIHRVSGLCANFESLLKITSFGNQYRYFWTLIFRIKRKLKTDFRFLNKHSIA